MAHGMCIAMARRQLIAAFVPLLAGCSEQPDTRSLDFASDGGRYEDEEARTPRADMSTERFLAEDTRMPGVPDNGVPDNGVPDNGVPDNGVPDNGVPARADGGSDGQPPSPSVHSFEGYAAQVSGGAGGITYTVTSLGSAGPGTLREAVGASKRVVRFAVSGTIRLSQPLRIVTHDLTVDGFTAPGPVTIVGMVEIIGSQAAPTEQASNIILRGLRFRQGYDSLRIWRNAHDIVVDHNSFSGAGDGSCDITEGAHNITFSWNIVARTAGSGKAMLFKYGAYHTSLHHNLFYRNEQRNPLVGSTTRSLSHGPPASAPLMDARYNVISHYGGYGAAVMGQDTSANFVANLFHTASVKGARPANHLRVKSGRLHAGGNVCVHDCRGRQFQTDDVVTTANSVSNSSALVAPPISGPRVFDRSARLAEWNRVVIEAGPCGRSTVFAGQDDIVEAEARSAVKAIMPATDVFDQPWNDD
jgi:hypothetical protein